MRDENAAQAFCTSSEKTAHAYGYEDFKIKCVTCDMDACNSKSKYGPIVLLVALPVAIAKIFLF